MCRGFFALSVPVLFLRLASRACFSLLFSSSACVPAVPLFWAFHRFPCCCFCCPGLFFRLASPGSAGGGIMSLIAGRVGVGSSSFGSSSSS